MPKISHSKGWYIGCPVREGQSEIHSSHKNRSPSHHSWQGMLSHPMTFHISVQRSSSAMRLAPGMPEFAKSEFSVIRLHEVKIMWNIRKQQWEKFFFLELGERLPICIACAQDFIWLHDVIQENLQYAGFIIPPKVRMAFILNDSLMYSSKLKAIWTKLFRLACCPFKLNVFKNNLSSSHPTLTSTHQGKSYR